MKLFILIAATSFLHLNQASACTGGKCTCTNTDENKVTWTGNRDSEEDCRSVCLDGESASYNAYRSMGCGTKDERK